MDGGYHQAAAQQGALIHQHQGFPKAFCLHLLLSLAGTLSENKRLLPHVKGLAFIKMIILFYLEHLLDEVHEACKEEDDKEKNVAGFFIIFLALKLILHEMEDFSFLSFLWLLLYKYSLVKSVNCFSHKAQYKAC